MPSAPRRNSSRVSSSVLVGCDHDHPQSGTLPHQFANRLRRIGGKRRLQNEQIGGEAFGCRQRLSEGLGLSHHPNIVFHGENLAQAGAEYRLRIGNNHSNKVSVAAICRVPARNLPIVTGMLAIHYPRSRSAALKTIFVNHHANPSASIIFHAAHHAAPAINLHVRVGAQNGRRQRDGEISAAPTGISASTRNNTPLEEIFCVSVWLSPDLDFTETGNLIGKRAALCRSE